MPDLLKLPDFDLNGDQLPGAAVLKEYEKYRITDVTRISKPTPVIKVAGELISTPGAITVISGAPKSGKTAFCSILIAGAIATEPIDGLDQVEVLLNLAEHAVIHFETEQAPWKQQYNLRNILMRAKEFTCPEHLLSYNLRQLEVKEMQQTVTEICEAAAEQFGGIHSIYVDGIADFIKDPNDPEASFDIVKFFEAVAQEHNCSVIVVLHTNPGSDKERGHLGSQVQRKAEAVLTVKKEGEVSYIDPKLLRHAGDNIPKIQFRYDPEKGYHTQYTPGDQAEDQAAQRLSTLRGLVDRIFPGAAGDIVLTWSEAEKALMRATGKGQSFAVNTLKEFKAYDLVAQDKKGGPYHKKETDNGEVV